MFKKPIFLALLLKLLPTIFLLHPITSFRVPFFIKIFIAVMFTVMFTVMFITLFALPWLISLFYFCKFKRTIPRIYGLKVAIYFALLSLFFNATDPTEILSKKYIIGTLAGNFLYIYLGIVIFARDLKPDEKVFYQAKKHSKQSLIFESICISLFFISLCIFDPSFFSLSTFNSVTPTANHFIFGFILMRFCMYLNCYLVSDFIVTDKRIIFKRFFYSSGTIDIPLEEIENIESSNGLFQMGTIRVTNKKGDNMVSIPIFNPDKVLRDIEHSIAGDRMLIMKI